MIAPSEAFVRWTRTELEKHTNWIKRELARLHSEFVTRAALVPNKLQFCIEQPSIPWASLAASARNVGRHALVADPAPVIAFGRTQRVFWASPPDKYGRNDNGNLYALPHARDVDEFKQWILAVPHILVGLPADVQFAGDKTTILQSADWTVLSAIAATRYHLPLELVRADILPSVLVDIGEQFDAEIAQIAPGPPLRLLKLTNPCRPMAFPNLMQVQWREKLWRQPRVEESVQNISKPFASGPR